MFKRVPGTKDILAQEISWWQKIEEISRNIFSIYNYSEIRPPLIEEAALFNRSLGKSTEIVQKQMFLINPAPAQLSLPAGTGSARRGSLKRESDVYVLRPEGTASIVRAYIENNLYKTSRFIKLYYIGPMFRRERPQKGRLRQFYHIGCEVIGSADAALDIEVVSLADRLLSAYLIKNYKIKINSLGCAEDKKELMRFLRRGLKDKMIKLCDECRIRFKHNILRILDCKNESCREVIKKLDIRDSYLCPECKTHFTKVREGLAHLKIDYEVTPYLVRGLDYYTRTVFEITHMDLGAQDALGAGGRYDSLVGDLGGPDVGAIGFAFGIERILLVTGYQTQSIRQNLLVYIITLDKAARSYGLRILDNLRKVGIVSDTDYEGRSLKGAMRKANDLGARYVLIIGEEELKKDLVTMKDMTSGVQREIKKEELIEELAQNVKLRAQN